MTLRKKNYEFLKRGLDIVGSGLGLVVLSPVIAVVGVVVRNKLGSPVIFKQDRPGKDGQLFTLYKFRSMLDVDESEGLVTNEERITDFGQKLRATSLDELPSLLNVLKGDMSLVGPRPLMVRYLDKYTPEQARRHEVRPGIAGLAQVNGRNNLGWDERFGMDVEYVDNRSLLLDIRLILETLRIVIQRDGIASEGHSVGSPFDGQYRGQDEQQETAPTAQGGTVNV